MSRTCFVLCPLPALEGVLISSCTRYTLEDMARSTDNWSESNVIGSGGFGTVYKGKDPNNPEILWAVKRAKLQSKAFKKEVSREGRVEGKEGETVGYVEENITFLCWKNVCLKPISPNSHILLH